MREHARDLGPAMSSNVNWNSLIPRFGSAGQWQSWLNEQLARCDDVSFGERFAEFVPFDGIAPASYQHRILRVDNAQLLAGIRFKGGDHTFPFVDLIAWSGEPTNAWPAALTHSFAEFHPRAFRWASTDVAAPPQWSGEVDQHVVAGLPNGCTHPLIQPANDLSWFDTFENAFREWQATDPIGDEVCPTEREVFEECLATGHVVIAQDRGQFLGVAACKQDAERSFTGWCMQEQFVIPAAQGRGLGTALQQALMRQLKPTDTLWGTIHGNNAASLAVAKKCGRQVVETWWFTPVSQTEHHANREAS